MSDDVVLRIAAIAVAAIAVVALALVTRRWQRPHQPQVDLSGLDLPAGIVLFTSTECANCARARTVVKTLGASVREVTWELEPHVFEAAGVESVPLTVVAGPDGVVADQIAGIPSRRRLVRALERG